MNAPTHTSPLTLRTMTMTSEKATATAILIRGSMRWIAESVL